VASLIGFRQDYHPFFNWIRPLLQQIQQAEPSAGHHFLAYLEQLGKLKAVITQNVDSLHTKAGNTTVYELHGHCRTATCTHCFRKFDATALLEALIKTGEIPMCACQPAGSVIKPDVILFGEQLPVKVVQATRRALIQADLLLVMGSSLQAEPAANIPYIVAEHGVKLVIINDEPTHIDSLAHVVLRGNIEGYIEPIIEVLETSYERS
jgi:NAD-dependent deacetylase